MRKIGDFIGANIFLLAIALVGVAVLAACAELIRLVFPDPEAVPWAWAAAAGLAIAAMFIGARRLHQLVTWLIWGRRSARG